jgi:phosphoribosylformylglycinamidine synthase I
MTKAAVMIIEGTNCEKEMKIALDAVGIETEIIHLKQFIGDCPKEKIRKLSDYDILMFPGGWSAGDYVRAGAIFAARIKSKLMPELKDFVADGKMVGGICNGFQILTELGLLPAFKGISDEQVAALANNKTHFQCRPSYLRHDNICAFTGKIRKGQVLQIPVAHGEGRLTFGEKDSELLKELIDNKQIIFRYCKTDGSDAGGEFPWNPNGSLDDIAGISNPEGNVLGMMPHPERVIHKTQTADWTRHTSNGPGDGRIFFESIAEYAKKKYK